MTLSGLDQRQNGTKGRHRVPFARLQYCIVLKNRIKEVDKTSAVVRAKNRQGNM